MFESSRSLENIQESNVPPSFASSKYKLTDRNGSKLFKSAHFLKSLSENFNSSKSKSLLSSSMASSQTLFPHDIPPSVVKSSRLNPSVSFTRSNGFNMSRVNSPPNHFVESLLQTKTPLAFTHSRDVVPCFQRHENFTELQANQIEGMKAVRFVFNEESDQCVNRLCSIINSISNSPQSSGPFNPLSRSFKHSSFFASSRTTCELTTSRCRPVTEDYTPKGEEFNSQLHQSKPEICPTRPADLRYYCSRYTTFTEQQKFSLPPRFKITSLNPKIQSNLRHPGFKASRFISLVSIKPKFTSSNSSNEYNETALEFDCNDFGYFSENKCSDVKKIIHANNILRSALQMFFDEKQ